MCLFLNISNLHPPCCSMHNIHCNVCQYIHVCPTHVKPQKIFTPCEDGDAPAPPSIFRCDDGVCSAHLLSGTISFLLHLHSPLLSLSPLATYYTFLFITLKQIKLVRPSPLNLELWDIEAEDHFLMEPMNA